MLLRAKPTSLCTIEVRRGGQEVDGAWARTVTKTFSDLAFEVLLVAESRLVINSICDVCHAHRHLCKHTVRALWNGVGLKGIPTGWTTESVVSSCVPLGTTILFSEPQFPYFQTRNTNPHQVRMVVRIKGIWQKQNTYFTPG